MSSDFCHLHISCKDVGEADQIVNVLLSKKLAACAKQIPVTSYFRWQGKIQNTKEILLIMESRLDLFSAVEKTVAKLHSYDTFVLEAIPVVKMSKKAQNWLTQELKNE